jgi:hypothetical protein
MEERNMNREGRIGVGILFLILLVACAMITVNIYFPEKAVEEAYKSLEKDLMAPGKGGSDQEPTDKAGAKPNSSIKIQLVTSAYAQEAGLAEKIAQTIKKMPDVVNAYKEMGARIADIDRLRERGAVGEGNNGMLMVRDEKLLTPNDKKLIAMENENRRVVMNGMAKAIIRINKVPENEQNLKQVVPQAVEQFASVRRDSAQKGWWIQDPYGNWTRK